MVRELSINTSEKFIEFRSIQYALFLTIFIEIIGSLFFFITALHIEKDKSVVDLTIAGESSHNSIQKTDTQSNTIQITDESCNKKQT